MQFWHKLLSWDIKRQKGDAEKCQHLTFDSFIPPWKIAVHATDIWDNYHTIYFFMVIPMTIMLHPKRLFYHVVKMYFRIYHEPVNQSRLQAIFFNFSIQFYFLKFWHNIRIIIRLSDCLICKAFLPWMCSSLLQYKHIGPNLYLTSGYAP